MIKRICRCFYFFNKKKEVEFSSIVENKNPSIQPFIASLPRTLQPISWNETKPFVPPITGGQVIRVYSGDTITIVSKMPYRNSPLYRFHIRLQGIDCPDIETTNE